MGKGTTNPARIKAVEEGTPIGSATETSSSFAVSEGQASGSAPPSSSTIDRLTAELAEAREELKRCRNETDRANELAALREALKDVEPVSTFTPILWFSLNDHPRYEEYIRVRTLLSDVAALTSSRLPSRQEEGRKDDDVTRIGQPDVPPAQQHASTDCADCEVLKAKGIDVRVLVEAYDWTYTVDGEIYGLTAGDHCFEPTGINVADIVKLASRASSKGESQ